MFSMIITENNSQKFTLEKIHQNLNLQKTRLTDNRIEIDPILYDKYLNQREFIHKKAPRQSNLNPDSLYPGTWYLKSIDEKYRRVYEKTASSNSNNIFINTKIEQYLIEELSRIK
jgi:hypothetical protein